MPKNNVQWSKRPIAEDYSASLKYLSLICTAAQARRLVSRLRHARPMEMAAKDLLRASRLPALPPDDAAVARDLKKIQKGKALSPVLLVQGDASKDVPLVIADGYHRICAAYHENESAEVMCLMTSR